MNLDRVRARTPEQQRHYAALANQAASPPPREEIASGVLGHALAIIQGDEPLYIAEIDTKYGVMALARTEKEAIRLVSRKAHEFLTAAGAIGPQTDTPAKIADYIGVHVTRLAVGAADFVDNCDDA